MLTARILSRRSICSMANSSLLISKIGGEFLNVAQRDRIEAEAIGHKLAFGGAIYFEEPLAELCRLVFDPLACSDARLGRFKFGA
jgi:hypothetical protein